MALPSPPTRVGWKVGLASQASPQLQFWSLSVLQYVARANWVKGANPASCEADRVVTPRLEVGSARAADAKPRTATAVV